MKRREHKPVHCEECGREWPRDPVLEVVCPTCDAQVGQSCTVLRPSEHRHSAAFAGLGYGHPARDLLAAAENKYGCGCGITPDEARRRLDAMLNPVTVRACAPDPVRTQFTQLQLF